MAEIHTSQRNNEKLTYYGFIYNRERVRCGTTYWTCHQRGICAGRATSVWRVGKLEVELTREHNHDPQLDEVALMRIRTNLKRRATEEIDAPAIDLVKEEIENLASNFVYSLREVENLCRVVSRSRESKRQKDPVNVADLEISECYFKTISGQQFLLHDNIIRNEVDQTTQRTVIFATENDICNLFASSVWYADGSFHIVPTMFYQLWTIHGKVKEYIVPLVYVLMQTKKEEEYLEVLVRLQQKAVELQVLHKGPTVIMVNFNRGAMNAIKTVFPQAKLNMCLFHYKHSLWRKIQDFCLQAEHSREGSMVKQWLWCAIGLAYVPPADVVDAFELLVKELESNEVAYGAKIKNFAEHLERNYVRGRQEGNRSLQHRYPIELWNIYERTLTDEVKNDSVVEEWQKKFDKIAQASKWAAHTIVSAIRKEQNYTECGLYEVSNGQLDFLQLVPDKTLRMNEQIRKHVLLYEEFKSAGNVLEYIRTAGAYNPVLI